MQGTLPIIQLMGGETICPRVPITDARVRNWKYAAECSQIYGTLAPGARLTIVEVCKQAGAMWVRAQIPGRDPAGYLKIAGDEYAAAFHRV